MSLVLLELAVCVGGFGIVVAETWITYRVCKRIRTGLAARGWWYVLLFLSMLSGIPIMGASSSITVPSDRFLNHDTSPGRLAPGDEFTVDVTVAKDALFGGISCLRDWEIVPRDAVELLGWSSGGSTMPIFCREYTGDRLDRDGEPGWHGARGVARPAIWKARMKIPDRFDAKDRQLRFIVMVSAMFPVKLKNYDNRYDNRSSKGYGTFALHIFTADENQEQEQLAYVQRSIAGFSLLNAIVAGACLCFVSVADQRRRAEAIPDRNHNRRDRPTSAKE